MLNLTGATRAVLVLGNEARQQLTHDPLVFEGEEEIRSAIERFKKEPDVTTIGLTLGVPVPGVSTRGNSVKFPDTVERKKAKWWHLRTTETTIPGAEVRITQWVKISLWRRPQGSWSVSDERSFTTERPVK